MAKLLVADGWAAPDPLALHLREALPDEYIVVADPIVHRQAFQSIVVGPQGLFVLHAKEWEGEIHPSRNAPWRARLPSGLEVRHPNPAEDVRRATDALLAFLRDEFPKLRPRIHHLLVLSKPDARVNAREPTEPPAMSKENVADAIASTETPSQGALLDERTREALAQALQERQLTASERAQQPFVFRSGGLLGSGKKAWTLREVVRHMDRHPADGIYHLRNGTLARWLADQGADHLAALAREVVRQRETDPRVPLETFLIGTGLVPRPRLVVRPKRLNLGHILIGQSAKRTLRIQKGRGRGYLFGNLRTSDPWLRVVPNAFSGRPLNAVVTVSTDTLLISQDPQQAEIYIDSSASQEPVSVPVRFRVVGMPSPLNRYLCRPLAGFVSAGLVGAGVGWLLASSGLGTPRWLENLLGPSLSPTGAWMLLIGFFWAALGWVRGFFQNLAWPITYATQRWLFRTLTWGVALTLLVSVTLWSWQQPYSGLELGISEAARTIASLFALAFAIVPAVLSEIWAARPAPDHVTDVSVQRPTLRPVLLVALGIILGFVIMAGARVVGPSWQRLDAARTVTQVEEWLGERWSRLETDVNGFIDQLYLRRYDRRAPAPPRPSSPTPSSPTPAVTPPHKP